MRLEDITLIDWFAGMAMKSLLGNDINQQRVAEASYDIAEAMIRESEKRLNASEESTAQE